MFYLEKFQTLFKQATNFKILSLLKNYKISVEIKSK